jgi:hypothetical protein
MNFTNTSDARNAEPRSSLINLWTYLNKNSNTLNSNDTFRNSGVLDSRVFKIVLKHVPKTNQTLDIMQTIKGPS